MSLCYSQKGTAAEFGIKKRAPTKILGIAGLN